jgi:hypothetical protein
VVAASLLRLIHRLVGCGEQRGAGLLAGAQDQADADRGGGGGAGAEPERTARSCQSRRATLGPSVARPRQHCHRCRVNPTKPRTFCSRCARRSVGSLAVRSNLRVRSGYSQMEFSHVLPVHALPVQVLPVQVLPVHVLPVQVLPVHVLPVQVLPE